MWIAMWIAEYLVCCYTIHMYICISNIEKLERKIATKDNKIDQENSIAQRKIHTQTICLFSYKPISISIDFPYDDIKQSWNSMLPLFKYIPCCFSFYCTYFKLRRSVDIRHSSDFYLKLVNIYYISSLSSFVIVYNNNIRSYFC